MDRLSLENPFITYQTLFAPEGATHCLTERERNELPVEVHQLASTIVGAYSRTSDYEVPRPATKRGTENKDQADKKRQCRQAS